MYAYIFSTVIDQTARGIDLVAYALGIVGIVGGAVGYFAKGRSEAVITLQSKENSLLKDDNARLEKALSERDARITQLEAENKRVWDKAQGSAQLVALAGEIKSLVEYLKEKEVKDG